MTKKAAAAPTDRSFAILELVVEEGGPIALAEIGKRLSLPAPTTHRLAGNLIELGYLKRSLGSKRLLPGPRLTQFGVRAARAAFSSDKPHTLLVNLSEELNKHCQIGVLVENQIVYVDIATAPRPQGLHLSPGASGPVHCTSTGKLHLAAMADGELQAFVAALSLKRFTERTICDPEKLLAEVERVRRAGWATTDGEYFAGVVGCAVPILDRKGRMIAGLGASAPNAHLAFEHLDQLVPAMKASAGRITQALDE